MVSLISKVTPRTATSDTHHHTNTDTTTHKQHTITNYKKAAWEEFEVETEALFMELNTSPITNIDATLAQFNAIILTADKKHIPKGNRKHHNPNHTPEIALLIRQHNNLRQTPTPHTAQTTEHIHELNTNINTLIKEEQLKKSTQFVETLDHKTGTSKLYRTIRGHHQLQQQHTTVTRSHYHIRQHTHTQTASQHTHPTLRKHKSPTKTQRRQSHKQTQTQIHTR